ncbi:Zn-dependent hydrolase [Paenibacillus sabinae]|uniref:Allantoate amidohydrolase n=1 Tax=Paenibacillus sabinae T27 TaxID=1268072 RepID=X4ZK13_9BACL|nr:Zn-dependent hydrolase [Paenibacillus sabinae]AHV97652.1 allantoate amidohydrolase [Paenibacillus sabinae T27]
MIAINKERVWKSILDLSEIGKSEHGGVTRLSFTEEEKRAKEYVTQRMKEAGLTVYEDPIGNLFGRWEGTAPSAPVVMFGSHIDSVLGGGNFDGPAGVLAAIEVVQTMREKGLTPDHPLEVAVFTDEEGARFHTGMIGSRAIVGKLNAEDLYKHKDDHQISIAEAMKASGLDPENLEQARRTPGSIKAYLELHIEQGKILESKDIPVGIVTGIAAPVWLQLTLNGKAGHAGTTPMDMRKDPLVAAAEIICKLEQLAIENPGTVGTVGKINALPGGVNIIPGRVELALDIRHPVEEVRNRVEDEIRAFIKRNCSERGIEYEIEVPHRLKPTPCSENVIAVVQDSVAAAGLPVQKLISGAAHDAMVMAEITEVGMIFVRSKDGISHHPDEWTSKEDLAWGTEVLYQSITRLAGIHH